jgi:hypothetical protein
VFPEFPNVQQMISKLGVFVLKDQEIKTPLRKKKKYANELDEIRPVSVRPEEQNEKNIDAEPGEKHPDPESLDPGVRSTDLETLSSVDHHGCGKQLAVMLWKCLAKEALCFGETNKL